MSTRGLDVAAWMMATLPSPSDPARDLVLTADQVDLLVAFYATDPAGRYVYRRAAIQGAKGIGKSPLAAMIALAELVGPSAPPDPLVQIAALSEEQATCTVYSPRPPARPGERSPRRRRGSGSTTAAAASTSPAGPGSSRP